MATKRPRRDSAGRPPVYGEPLTERVVVRLSAEDAARIRVAAESEGCSVAEWIRRAAEDRIRGAERLVAALGRGRVGEEGR